MKGYLLRSLLDGVGGQHDGVGQSPASFGTLSPAKLSGAVPCCTDWACELHRTAPARSRRSTALRSISFLIVFRPRKLGRSSNTR